MRWTRVAALALLTVSAGCVVRPYIEYTPRDYDATPRSVADSTEVRVVILPAGQITSDTSQAFPVFRRLFESRGIDLTDYRMMGSASTCLTLGVDYSGQTVTASFTREQAIEALRGEAARRGACLILVAFREWKYEMPAFGLGIHRGYVGEHQRSASYVDAVLFARNRR